ncbi:MAG TPA: hypothetical protein EYP91_07755 [Gammaproteobacteria bacterium]|nr:hypothetical protein [Gammaproteobacteria bacterium]
MEASKPTKKKLTTTVFNRMLGQGTKRKDIITAFIDECGLTKAGAPTYYADIKKQHLSKKSEIPGQYPLSSRSA